MGWEPGAWTWLVPAGLGALAYTSLNSLGWVLADRTRHAYAVPMVVGLAGALIAMALLVAGAVIAAPGSQALDQAGTTGSIGYPVRIWPPVGVTR